MARKHIPDALVIFAVLASKEMPTGTKLWPYQILHQWTGEPEKVCYAALERADKHGLIEWGVSLRSGWPTEKALKLIQIEELKDAES